jgi:hypothetical protein
MDLARYEPTAGSMRCCGSGAWRVRGLDSKDLLGSKGNEHLYIIEAFSKAMIARYEFYYVLLLLLLLQVLLLLLHMLRVLIFRRSL